MVQPITPLTRNTTYRLTHHQHLPRFFPGFFSGWVFRARQCWSSRWDETLWSQSSPLPIEWRFGGKYLSKNRSSFWKMGEGNGKVGVTWSYILHLFEDTSGWSFATFRVAVTWTHLTYIWTWNYLTTNKQMWNCDVVPRTTDLLFRLVSLQSWFKLNYIIRHFQEN